MKNLFGCVVFFMVVCGCMLCADSQDFNRDQTIINGLSKKKLNDRLKYIDMAKYSDSPAVFEKLRQMYKVDNIIKSDVFVAMEWQNINNRGAFAEKMVEVMKEEFYRLKELKLENRPQNHYLTSCLALCQEYPFPEYDNFVDYVMNNIDSVLEDGVDNRTDPVKLKADIIGQCIFYFALRDRPGYMDKLIEVFKREDIAELGLVLKLFAERKNEALFEYVTELIKEQYDKKELSGYFLDDYIEYAKAINKEIPENVKFIIKEGRELGKKTVEDLFEGM